MSQNKRALFRLEIHNATGELVNAHEGPIHEIAGLSITSYANGMGDLTLDLLANDPRLGYLDDGSYARVYVDGRPYGKFYVEEEAISLPNGVARIELNDQLEELRRASSKIRTVYTSQYVAEIVTDLLARAGWSCSIKQAGPLVDVTIEGSSILGAIVKLCESYNMWFRLDGESRITIGTFENATVSQYLVTGRQTSPDVDVSGRAYLGGMTRERSFHSIVNRIYPLGAGEGTAQVDLSAATASGTYTIGSELGADGTTLYYLENATSVAFYGRREEVVVFRDIRPLSNSDAAIEAAANTLYYAASAYLDQRGEPLVSYGIDDVYGLDPDLLPCDLIHVRHVEEQSGTVIFTADEDLYVTRLTRVWTSEGEHSAQLGVAGTLYAPPSDVDIISAMKATLGGVGVNIQPALSKERWGPMMFYAFPANDISVNVDYGDETLSVLYSKLRVRWRNLVFLGLARKYGEDQLLVFEVNSTGASNPSTASTTTEYEFVNGSLSPSYTRLVDTEEDVYTEALTNRLADGNYSDEILYFIQGFDINGVDVLDDVIEQFYPAATTIDRPTQLGLSKPADTTYPEEWLIDVSEWATANEPLVITLTVSISGTALSTYHGVTGRIEVELISLVVVQPITV